MKGKKEDRTWGITVALTQKQENVFEDLYRQYRIRYPGMQIAMADYIEQILTADMPDYIDNKFEAERRRLSRLPVSAG